MREIKSKEEVLLSKIVAGVESNNDKYALRFEESWYEKSRNDLRIQKLLHKVMKLNYCSRDTAKMIIATSWGKYQILGYNIYQILGYKGKILEYVENEKEQDLSFFSFLNVIKVKAERVVEELEEILKVKNELVLSGEKFIEEFKEYLTREKEKNYDVCYFITRYNGAKVGSIAFMDYLLRMLYYYEKYAKEV